MIESVVSPGVGLPNHMDVEQEELKVPSSLDIIEDENLYELEIKNLDTNEVMKMKIPIDHCEQLFSESSSASGGK